MRNNIKISVVGLWHLGSVTASCLADKGFMVNAYDHDENIINNFNNGVLPIYEPGLQELVQKNMLNGNICFDYNLKPHIKDADAILLAVGTPGIENSKEVDLSYLMGAVEEIKKLASCINPK